MKFNIFLEGAICNNLFYGDLIKKLIEVKEITYFFFKVELNLRSPDDYLKEEI